MRKPLSSFSPLTELSQRKATSLPDLAFAGMPVSQQVRVFSAAIFLVVVPVFFQAPLVRSLPWLSLTLTGTWLMAGLSLLALSSRRKWGDLLVGFTWTWFAGSIYWGWLRWEPLFHLPVEALGIPIVLVLLSLGRGRIGSYFYLGSLFGTAITDLYIYWADLLPFWRQVMQVDPQWVPVVLQEAANAVRDPLDFSRALMLILILLTVGLLPLKSNQLCWWAFSGAVLSTLIVDLLFFTSALFI